MLLRVSTGPTALPFHLSLSRGYVLSTVLQIPVESWSAAEGSRAHLTHWGEPGTTDSVLQPRQTHGDIAGASEGNEGGPESRVTADTSRRDSPATGQPSAQPLTGRLGPGEAGSAPLGTQLAAARAARGEPSVSACKRISKRFSLSIVH